MQSLRNASLQRHLGAWAALWALAWLLAMPGWGGVAGQALAGAGADICRAASEPGANSAPMAPGAHCSACPCLGQGWATPPTTGVPGVAAWQGVLPGPALRGLPRVASWHLAQPRAPPAVG